MLALRDPAKAVDLVGVPTGADARAALEASGLTVGGTAAMRDVDTVADAVAVAALGP